MSVLRILIMAGGTGGHVFPALAVAKALEEKGAEIVWMGTRSGIEARLVPDAGIAIEWVTIKGLRGKRLWSWLLAPFKLMMALMQALMIIRRTRPSAVLGMGGFVSGPGGLMAWLMKKPLLIHEQNAVAGMTNRILSRLATVTMTAFPDTRALRPGHLDLGNPVRVAIAQMAAPAQRYQSRKGCLRVLVLGGSQGAAVLNKLLPQAVAELDELRRPIVWHQTGREREVAVREAYQASGIEARVDDFIDDMKDAYDWADLVICRSGALTVSELACAGVASILVPYPWAVDDHQAVNAAYLSEHGAALMVRQEALTKTGLADMISGFFGADGVDHGQARKALLVMAEAARQRARPDAVDQVVRQCLEVAYGTS